MQAVEFASTGPLNAFTVDVEDWYQVSAFEPYLSRRDWSAQVSRVERNTEAVLELLDGAGIKATFFALGWVAERHPALVRRIVAAGHELASHGHDHQRVRHLGPAAFLADIRRARNTLEQAAGCAVRGYRAPTFSLGPQTPWAYGLLAEAGYRYSSSVAPVHHDLYGDPAAPRWPFDATDGIREVPVSTVRLARRNVPCAGGGFFRLYPYWFSRWCLRRINETERQPCNFYLHPWEIDPGQPILPRLDLRTRFRHRLNLAETLTRLRQLLRDFRWGRMDEAYAL